MKKIYLLFITFILLIVTSCSQGPADVIYESGFFQYKIMDLNSDGNKEVLIMGLSEEGKQQTTIVIPVKIDGYEVTTLGHYYGFLGRQGVFESEKLKVIYITNNITNIENELLFDSVSLEKIYTGNFKSLIGAKWLELVLNSNQLFLSNLLYNQTYQFFLNYNALNKCNIANVLYDLNYGENNIFMVDDCDGTTVNVIPPTPYRKGYEFAGWYKEPECINEWEFENDIVPTKEYDKNREYILKETKLYAKWEKNNEKH